MKLVNKICYNNYFINYYIPSFSNNNHYYIWSIDSLKAYNINVCYETNPLQRIKVLNILFIIIDFVKTRK